MAQRRPNRPPPPQPGSRDKISGMVLADPLYAEASAFFPPPDGHYLSLENCTLEKSEMASRSQRGSMN